MPAFEASSSTVASASKVGASSSVGIIVYKLR